METALERRPGTIGDKVELARTRQDFAAADQVVNCKTEPEHERRAAGCIERQHEAERPDQVRRHAQQHLTLAERGAHEAERAVLQVAKPAVDQLRRRRRGARGKVVLLDQNHLEPAPGGIAGDAGAVDAAANDGKIEIGHCLVPGQLCRFTRLLGESYAALSASREAG